MSIFVDIEQVLQIYVFDRSVWYTLLLFFPFILVIELPFYCLTLIAALRAFVIEIFSSPERVPFHPPVTCIITCYNEEESITSTIKTLLEQLYKGYIEILVIVDGANINQSTLAVAQRCAKQCQHIPNRSIQVIAKNVRGGRSSTNNLGLKLAKGEIIVVLDGDTSCDNDMIAQVSYDFLDPHVVGVSGTLRVRNAKTSLATRLQAIEYMLGIHLARIGLAKIHCINNLSGAFAVFRKDFLRRIGGWKNGTAEDLDLTTRIHAYCKRYPHLKLQHNHHAIVHTDAPETFLGLLKQRLRWDGDLFFIYCRRRWRIFRPKFLGWRHFFILVWSGLLFNLVMPFMIVFYLFYLLITSHMIALIILLFTTYCFYLCISVVLFLCYFLLVSERKKQDATFLWCLPLMPIYQTGIRIWAAVAIVCEMVLKTHKDSAMAPWWVLRKADE